jgi:serine/threonine protein phosphatase PrpC
VSDEEIRDRLARDESSEENVRALVDLALGRGGSDNVTAVVGKTRSRTTPPSSEAIR